MTQAATAIHADHDHAGHDHAHHHHPAPSSEERTVDIKIVAALLGGTLLIASVLAKFVFETPQQSAVLAAIATILLGGPIVYDAVMGLLGRCTHDHGGVEHLHADTGEHDHEHHGSHMEELVAIAIFAAFANGEYLEAGAVAFFMLITMFIEHRTAVGARKTIESLMRITPTRARKLVEGEEQEVDAATLVPGDRVIVRPGDNIPGDGIVRTGQSTVDQANITGESLPVEKDTGDEVFSGTINETGAMEIEITRAGKDSTLGRVQDLILQAASSRPAVVRMLDRYAGYYTPVVLMIGAIIYYFTGDLNRVIALLLVACPCAIILAAPTAMIAGISAASRLGVYIKNVTDLEVARRVSAIVFDKTGTLTVGHLEVSRLFPVDGVEPAELLRICASAEQNSNHPVAKAVVAMAQKANVQTADATDFAESAGRGVTATVDGESIVVGREAWLKDHGVDVAGLDIDSGDGMSLLFVARNGQPIGWVGMEDKVRAGAMHAMDDLDELGIKRRVMITGDRWSPARKVARELHVTDLEAEALPGDKLELVKSLKAKGHTVCVIGDGVNDGPALAAGDISIAMGAAGSDVAINSASIALMNNNLNRIPFVIGLSQKTVTVIWQNLIGTLIYVLFMLALLTLGYITPLVAAIAHGVSSIIVIFNSARLVREGETLEDHVPVDQPGTHRPAHVEQVTQAPDTPEGTTPQPA